MQSIQIGDLRITVPIELAVERRHFSRCRTGFVFTGPSLDSLRRQIERSAMNSGYHVEKDTDVTIATKCNQTVTLDSGGADCLVIIVDDPDQLPCAATSSEGVVLGPLRVSLGGEVVPMTECHEPESASWSASWRIRRLTPDAVMSQVHDSLIHQGYRLGATFSPAGGRRTWTSEAFSENSIVKIHVTDQPNDVRLDLSVDQIGCDSVGH